MLRACECRHASVGREAVAGVDPLGTWSPSRSGRWSGAVAAAELDDDIAVLRGQLRHQVALAVTVVDGSFVRVPDAIGTDPVGADAEGDEDLLHRFRPLTRQLLLTRVAV